jgi:hypothetical protein
MIEARGHGGCADPGLRLPRAAAPAHQGAADSLHNALMRWVPGGDALNAMTATVGGRRPLLFSAWGELAVFAGYAAILLVLGAVQFARRDA